jgi:1-deoxy-D-xylulose-5-phosphate reductoisomerase
MKDLTFSRPDTARFPCLRLAVDAIKQGGTCPAALCAADETAVELFLAGQIRFTDIPEILEQALNEHTPVTKPSLDDILEADTAARKITRRIMANRSNR